MGLMGLFVSGPFTPDDWTCLQSSRPQPYSSRIDEVLWPLFLGISSHKTCTRSEPGLVHQSHLSEFPSCRSFPGDQHVTRTSSQPLLHSKSEQYVSWGVKGKRLLTFFLGQDSSLETESQSLMVHMHVAVSSQWHIWWLVVVWKGHGCQN